MRDKILQQTNGGLNVFTHYIGDVVKKKSFCNPFRGDKAPSCRLYYRQRSGEGVYYMIDYGDSAWCGDCFSIAAKVVNLDVTSDFPELLKTINKDLNLFISDEMPVGEHKPMERSNTGTLLSSGPLDFRATYQNFHPWELKYWNRYGITLEVLQKYDVRSIRSCQFIRHDGTRFTLTGTYMEPMYGYLFNNGTGIKVYRPFSKLRFMYAGTLPKPYMFGWNHLQLTAPKKECILITGGEKDVMTLVSHGFNALALNSESAKISEELMETLSKHYNHIVFAYDCDETGKRESKNRVDEFCLSYPVSSLTLPLSGSKKEKDVSDFFSMGHTASEYSQLVNAITK